MKKLNILLAAVAGLAVSAGSALADTTVKLVEVITSPQRTEFLKKQIAEFETANPGVKVEVFRSGTTEVMAKLAAEFAAGQAQRVMLQRSVLVDGGDARIADFHATILRLGFETGKPLKRLIPNLCCKTDRF